MVKSCENLLINTKFIMIFKNILTNKTLFDFKYLIEETSAHKINNEKCKSSQLKNKHHQGKYFNKK